MRVVGLQYLWCILNAVAGSHVGVLRRRFPSPLGLAGRVALGTLLVLLRAHNSTILSPELEISCGLLDGCTCGASQKPLLATTLSF